MTVGMTIDFGDVAGKLRSIFTIQRDAENITSGPEIHKAKIYDFSALSGYQLPNSKCFNTWNKISSLFAFGTFLRIFFYIFRLVLG